MYIAGCAFFGAVRFFLFTIQREQLFSILVFALSYRALVSWAKLHNIHFSYSILTLSYLEITLSYVCF